MKKILSLLMVVLFVTGVQISAAASAVDKFADVNPSDWFYKAVDYAVKNNLFKGVSETEFKPNDSMTRGMFVTVLSQKTGINKKDFIYESFDDVSLSRYYGAPVEWASANEIVKGMGNRKFAPDLSITREQMATILFNYAKKTNNNTSYSSALYDTFSDRGEVSKYAVEAIKWATTHKILTGTGGNKLSPKDTATRGQVAQMFKNADSILKNTDIVNPADPSVPPRAVVYEGSGDQVIKISPPSPEYIFYIRGNESKKHFAVIGYDEKGEWAELLVNTTDKYSGITMDSDYEIKSLEIKSSGEWYIEVRPLSSAAKISKGKIVRGEGDNVLLISNGGDTATISGNNGGRHFAVISHGITAGYSGYKLMVNTVDPYSGTVMMNKEARVLQILASGEWSIILN